MPSFLWVDNQRAVGSCVCYRYVGATPVQFGTAFGTKWSTNNVRTLPRHSAAHYKGNVYALAQDGIYVKDDPTTDAGGWTQALAFTNPATGDARSSGLHVVTINNEQVLCCVFGDAGGVTRWRWAKFDGTTWTQAATDTVSSSMQSVAEVAVYRNVIHVIGGGTVPIAMTFDPATESFATPSSSWGGAQHMCDSMCVFNDRLLTVWYTGSLRIQLAEYTAGSWTNLPGSDAGYTTVSMNPNAGKWALFTDGTYLYGIVPAATTDGWRCMRWDSSLGTPVDVTSTVMPGNLKSSTDGGTYPNQIELGRFIPVIDMETNPASPTIWLYFCPDANALGSPWFLYRWNGEGALLGNAGSPDDSGGVGEHSPPSGMLYFGEHSFFPGELDIEIVDRVSSLGGETISFVAYGGGTGRNMKLWYLLQGEPIPFEATLAAPVTGGSATLNGALNRVEGINADGVTVYTVVWDAQADGVDPGDRVLRVPQVIV